MERLRKNLWKKKPSWLSLRTPRHGFSILLTLLVGLLSGPSLADDAIEALLDQPQAAWEFDYCEWRFEHSGSAAALPDFETLLDGEAGDVPAERRQGAGVARAGTRVALAAKNKRQCRKIFEEAMARYENATEKALKRLRGSARFKVSDDPEILAIQRKITDLWVEDQAGRQVYIKSRTDDKDGLDYLSRRMAAARSIGNDARATSYIRDLLTEIDWVDSHRFGEAVAAHAWILVQHADAHRDLQKEVLGRMEKHLETGGVRKRDYAYLWDRVAVNFGEKQRYGTQPDWECKANGLELMPMEDPDDVDARRATMGLGTAASQLAEMSLSVCGK